ncbi:fumarylacetoacetate hydrolase family protein [Maricurvus nonylphenolicus]|uniref:fumarylacetoacetate hydrolase family protein n=1 Tax=Maricurvus nonylphenolicus TaxID=1008307 RepID=UPI0036F29269
MKLRRVKSTTEEAEFKVEALIHDQWRRLDSVDGLSEIARQHQVQGDLASDLLAVLQLGKTGWDALTAALEKLPVSDAEKSSVVVLPFQPASFREFTLYEEHFTNVARAHVRRYMPGLARITNLYERLTGKTFPKFKPNKLWYQQPVYYYGSHLNFYADGETVPWPGYVKDLDYELELAAIVSKTVCNADQKQAADAIGGFVIVNDFSSRGAAQMIEMGSGCGPQKSKHFANSMGAVVVTADELLGKEENLKGRISINGETVSTCHSRGMKFTFAEIVAFLSEGQTLYPGEILASGTLPCGSGMECGRLLSPGDKLRFELEGVGSLENFIG